MNSIPIILFLFFGNSNMNGDGCGQGVFYKHDQIVYYIGPNHGFIDDPIKAGYSSKGIVYPFLESMALRFPDRKFGACKYSYASAILADFKQGENHHDRMAKDIADLKGRVIFGGAICNYGFIEGKSKILAKSFGFDAMLFINELRRLTGNENLPVIWMRYEVNNLREDGIAAYRKYDVLIYENIESLLKSPFIHLCPIKSLPENYYCDDHHNTAAGFEIMGQDIAALYQFFGYDIKWNIKPFIMEKK